MLFVSLGTTTPELQFQGIPPTSGVIRESPWLRGIHTQSYKPMRIKYFFSKVIHIFNRLKSFSYAFVLFTNCYRYKYQLNLVIIKFTSKDITHNQYASQLDSQSNIGNYIPTYIFSKRTKGIIFPPGKIAFPSFSWLFSYLL